MESSASVCDVDCTARCQRPLQPEFARILLRFLSCKQLDFSLWHGLQQCSFQHVLSQLGKNRVYRTEFLFNNSTFRRRVARLEGQTLIVTSRWGIPQLPICARLGQFWTQKLLLVLRGNVRRILEKLGSELANIFYQFGFRQRNRKKASRFKKKKAEKTAIIL